MKKQLNWALMLSLLTGCGMNPVASLGSNGAFGANAIHSLPYKSIEMSNKKGAVVAENVSDGILLLAATGAADTMSRFSFSLDNGTSGNAQYYPALPAQTGDARARSKRTMDSRMLNEQQYAYRALQNGNLPRYRTMAASAPQAVETFNVSDSETNKNENVSAKLIKTSKNAYFFVDQRDLNMVDLGMIEKIASYWDNTAYPTANKTFGGAPKAYDIDNDSRVYFLFSHLLHDGVCGYFRPIDMISDVEKSQPGNPHKMLYLGSWMAQKSSAKYLDLVNSTLIHEYQHLLNFYHKFRVPAFQGKKLKGMESLWLNEGLSVYAEQLGGYGLPAGEECAVNYVSSFLEKNPNAPLVTENYKNFMYGEAYLFMLYLVDRFGPSIPTKLIQSEELGIENVEKVTGEKFEDLFKDWVMALYADGKEKGYGFDMIDLNKTYGGHKFSGLKAIEIDKVPAESGINVPTWSPVVLHVSPKAKTKLRVAVTAAGPFAGALFTK